MPQSDFFVQLEAVFRTKNDGTRKGQDTLLCTFFAVLGKEGRIFQKQEQGNKKKEAVACLLSERSFFVESVVHLFDRIVQQLNRILRVVNTSAQVVLDEEVVVKRPKLQGRCFQRGFECA
jgi:hypothetical protein